MQKRVQKENQTVVVSKFFNDSAFSLFIHELSRKLSEKQTNMWREKIGFLDQENQTKLRDFLRSKMRTFFFSIFSEEIKNQKNDNVIFGLENNLNISFEHQHISDKNSSLIMERGSGNGSQMAGGFIEKSRKDSFELAQDDSFLEDKELKDLL